jgi:hypothetical protein
MKKQRKPKVSEVYTIPNVTTENDLLTLYNKVLDTLCEIERRYKQACNIRKFDISDYWTINHTNGKVSFNVLNTAPALISLYLMRVFEDAHNYWLNKR